MSAIVDIYAGLAAKEVTVYGITPPVQDHSDLTSTVESADLPIRILHPFTGNRLSGGFSFVGIGDGIAATTWTITDMLLWKPQAEGLGLVEVTRELVAYGAAYAEMLRTWRAPTVQSHLTQASITHGLIEYPQQSGRKYFGVTCTLTVEEFLTNA